MSDLCVTNPNSEASLLSGPDSQTTPFTSIFQFGLYNDASEGTKPGSCKITSSSKCTECASTYIYDDDARHISLKQHFMTEHAQILSSRIALVHEAIQYTVINLDDSILNTALAKHLRKSNDFSSRTALNHSKNLVYNATEANPNYNARALETKALENTIIRELLAKYAYSNYREDSYSRTNLKTLDRVSRREVIGLRIVNLFKNWTESGEEGPKMITVGNSISDSSPSHHKSFSITHKFLGFTPKTREGEKDKDYAIALELSFEGAKISGLVSIKQPSILLLNSLMMDRIISEIKEASGAKKSLLMRIASYFKNTIETAKPKGELVCVQHVLNICAETILDYTFFRPLSSVKFLTSLKNLESENPDLGNVTILARALPNFIRTIIDKINSKSLLADIFAEELLKCRFKPEARCVYSSLVRDNETDWQSTYEMLDRFIYFERDITSALARTKNLQEEEKAALQLDEFEIEKWMWEYLKFLHDVLQVFQDSSAHFESLAGESFSHISISGVLIALEDLHSFDTSEHSESNAYLDKGLHMAYEKLLSYFPLQNCECAKLEKFQIESGSGQEACTSIAKRSVFLEETTAKKKKNNGWKCSQGYMP